MFKNHKATILLLISVLIVLVGSFSNLLINKNKKIKEQIGLLEAFNDTICIYKDKDSLMHSKIATLNTENTKMFTRIKNKDSQITDLQKLANKYKKQIKNGGSITNTITVTKYDTIFSFVKDTGKIIGKDTILNSINNEWIKSTFGFLGKKIKYDLQITNKYSVIIGEEKGKRYAEVINYNPYSSTVQLRTYELILPKQKKKLNSIGIQTGFGGVYNIQNNNLGYGPYIGLGYSFNILNW